MLGHLWPDHKKKHWEAIVIKNQHHYTQYKPISAQSLPADTEGHGDWLFLLHSDWPHIRTVPVYCLCYIIHTQSPTLTIMDESFRQWPIYSSLNCPLLPIVCPFEICFVGELSPSYYSRNNTSQCLIRTLSQCPHTFWPSPWEGNEIVSHYVLYPSSASFSNTWK